jgi:hypothetical protein
MELYYDSCQRAMGLFDYDLDLSTQVSEYLGRVGFENGRCIKRKLPLGIWAGNETAILVALNNKEACVLAIDFVRPGKALRGAGMLDAEKEVWSAKIKASLREHLYRCYHQYFWHTQTPEKVV